MFGYSVDAISQIFSSLEATKESQTSESNACKSRSQALREEAQMMKQQAQAMKQEAQSLRAQVPGLRAQASALNSKQEWTTETTTVTDPETGETTTTTESVRDYAAEAANRAQAAALNAQADQMEARATELEAKAAELEAEAATNEAEAAALDALAAMLIAAAAAIIGQITIFRNTQSQVESIISKTVSLLTSGSNLISSVISGLDIPTDSFVGNWGSGILEGALNLLGINLEDGLTDEVYKSSEGLVNTGGFVVKGLLSYGISAALGGGVLGQVGNLVVNRFAGIVIDNVFNEKTAAATGDAIISGLGLLGIDLGGDTVGQSGDASFGEILGDLAGTIGSQFMSGLATAGGTVAQELVNYATSQVFGNGPLGQTAKTTVNKFAGGVIDSLLTESGGSPTLATVGNAISSGLSVIGIDFDDGLTDEVQMASGGLIDIGGQVAKGLINYAADQALGDGALGQVGKTVVNKFAGQLIDNVFNEKTAAKAGEAVVSGLGMIGVNLDSIGFSLATA